MTSDYTQYIWNFLMTKIKNEYGVAGLMGNLEAESGMIPYRVQGDNPVSSYSVNYTNKVDSGTISKNTFIYHGPNGGGYGLAQWTTYGRKEGLYDMHISMKKSIGNIDVGLAFLWKELNESYKDTLNVLLNATDILTASNYVLMHFEIPADMGEAVQRERCNNGIKWYNKYSGSEIDESLIPPIDDYPTEPPLPSEEEKDSIYNLLIKYGYNMLTIPQSKYTLLKKLEIGDSCKIVFSFDKNKKRYGFDMYGKRVKTDNNIYTIVTIRKNGYVGLCYKKGNIKYIKPQFLKGVNDT